jgi:CHASE3 domain sensor protein
VVINLRKAGKWFRTGASLLLVAALVDMAFVVRESSRARDASRFVYTRAVKLRDITDTAGNALSALNDAVIREQGYVLTGETIYSEAYLADIRTWQDEMGSLELLARSDPAAPLVRDFSKAGARTLDELAAVVSLYDKDVREAALSRVRKGSGIVYLDEAREIAAKIREIDGRNLDGASQSLLATPARSIRHVAWGAAVLFAISLAGSLAILVLASDIMGRNQLTEN